MYKQGRNYTWGSGRKNFFCCCCCLPFCFNNPLPKTNAHLLLFVFICTDATAGPAAAVQRPLRMMERASSRQFGQLFVCALMSRASLPMLNGQPSALMGRNFKKKEGPMHLSHYKQGSSLLLTLFVAQQTSYLFFSCSVRVDIIWSQSIEQQRATGFDHMRWPARTRRRKKEKRHKHDSKVWPLIYRWTGILIVHMPHQVVTLNTSSQWILWMNERRLVELFSFIHNWMTVKKRWTTPRV